MLTVRSGPWAIVNVHAESGGNSRDRDERATQLLHISRLHEHEGDRVSIIAGDCNAREGDDHCLLAEGWSDQWCTPGREAHAENWTWRAGNNSARYDRIYMHASHAASARCNEITRLTSIWGDLTDHVAIHAVFRLSEHASAAPASKQAEEDTDVPGSLVSVVHRAGDGGSGGASSSADGPCRLLSNSGPSPHQRHAEMPGRRDVEVCTVANRVSEGVDKFHELMAQCQQDPWSMELRAEADLVPWSDVPVAAGFKDEAVGGGMRLEYTLADQVEQQLEYTRFKQWVEACGLDLEQVGQILDAVPKQRHLRGKANIVICLRAKNARIKEHVVQECRQAALRKAVAEIGSAIGGEGFANDASEHLEELLNDEVVRLSACAKLPQQWCDRLGLDLPSNCFRVEQGLRCVPALFEMWCRSAGAKLLGAAAVESWRDRLEAARSGDNSIPVEEAPAAFSLDGSVCAHMLCNQSYVRRPERSPVQCAWRSFVWETACAEVAARFGDLH